MARSSLKAMVGLVLLSLAGVAACDAGGGEMAILDVEPKVGHTNGDQPVRILGANFRQDIGYTIYFGTKKSKSVTILDPETILATTPQRVQPGDVDIMIRADDGNAFKIPGVFKFEDMGGDVMGGMGNAPAAKEEEKGNLQF